MKEVFLYHTINSTIFTLFNFIHIIKLSKIPFTYINLFCRSILTLQLFFTIHIGRPHQRYFDSVYKSFRIEIRIKKLENNLVEKTHINSNANPYHLLLIQVNIVLIVNVSKVSRWVQTQPKQSMKGNGNQCLLAKPRHCREVQNNHFQNIA